MKKLIALFLLFILLSCTSSRPSDAQIIRDARAYFYEICRETGTLNLTYKGVPLYLAIDDIPMKVLRVERDPYEKDMVTAVVENGAIPGIPIVLIYQKTPYGWKLKYAR
ncbi:hypothetical protein DRQ18_02905 [bacterium]|nr:MAG: hypothetical protein DRQ18_02905 [bacterium]